jgi:hypothetical protein
VPDNDSRTVLELQHLAKTGDVVRQRGQGELRCNDLKPVGLEPLDDGAPAGTVGPGTMD